MRKLQLTSAIWLLAAMTAVSPSFLFAQGGLTWASSYQIQNLESSLATVQLAYYSQATGLVAASGSVTVPASGSKTVFPFTAGATGDDIVGPSPFNGSLVMSSDRQVAVILNNAGSGTQSVGGSVNGFSAGATTLNIPLIVCNNSGFNTWFNVQNAGTGDANFTVTYIPGSNGLAGLTDVVTGLKEGAAKTFDQQEGSSTGTKTCVDLKDGSNKFIGSAQIVSTNGQPLVASTMFLGTGTYKTLQSYNGFTAGSTTVSIPLILANVSNYYTGVQIQNAGASSTTVTVTFSANTQGAGTPNPETFALAAGVSKTLIQAGGISSVSPSNNWTAFGKYVGSATITQTGTESLIAVVNQNNTSITNVGSSYEGFGAATATINIPLLMANNSSYYSSMQIQAVSGNPTVTVDYTTNTAAGALVEPVSDSKALTTGQSWTLIQAGTPGPLTGLNNWSIAGRYIGSAIITATGGTVVAIVNLQGPTTGDTFYTYNGFNTP